MRLRTLREQHTVTGVGFMPDFGPPHFSYDKLNVVLATPMPVDKFVRVSRHLFKNPPFSLSAEE